MTTVQSPRTLLRLADEVDEGIRSRQYRAAKRGEFVRLAPGTYLVSAEWKALRPDDQYLALIEAALGRVRNGEVLSHWSAAALWQLPIIGAWPSTVHVTAPVAAARRSTTILTRHRRSLGDDPVVLAGKLVTSLAETVVDIARVAPFSVALAMGDAALRRDERSGLVRSGEVRSGLVRSGSVWSGGLISPLDLSRVIESAGERRGIARARRVIGAVDARADRPGESLSRATMIRLGVPLPELQHRIVGPRGNVYFLDFYWPGQNIGADFDGRMKYLDPEYRGGRTADQVVYDEKVREDDVRLDLDGYGRWDWTVAGSTSLMAERLRRIGLRW